jgi:hypothetical protein
MQTPGQAFRKALERVLSADTYLSRTLTGGFHFNFATQLEENSTPSTFATPPKSPYAVITILPFTSEKGNGGRDIGYRPIIRIIVYGQGNGSILRTDCDNCARRIDQLVKDISETILDDVNSATDDDFQVLNFYWQSGINDDVTDSTGSKYTRIGAEYLANGYYVHCS